MNSMTKRQALSAIGFVALLCMGLASCSAKKATEPPDPNSVVLPSFDDAFVELFPDYCKRVSEEYAAPPPMERPKGAETKGPKGAGKNDDLVTRLAILASQGVRPTIVIASPWVFGRAKNLTEQLVANIIVPYTIVPYTGSGVEPLSDRAIEWDEAVVARPPRIFTLGYDYATAYRTMGQKAGKLVQKAVRKGDVDAKCSIIFQENFLRGKEALDAFKAGFEEGAGGTNLSGSGEPQTDLATVPHLDVHRFGPDLQTVDLVGTLQGALSDSTAKETKVVVCAIDDAALAIQAATGRLNGVAFMADTTTWEQSGKVANEINRARFSFVLKGNDEGMFKATEKLVNSILKGKPLQDHTLVPLKLK